MQFGTQQRSGAHFQEAAKIVQEGQLGKITHAVIQFPGSGYGTPPEPEAPVPEGLNWELFQGPAPRRPFKAGRLRWRGWWDYGGGLITDWGVHLTDVALWYLNSQQVGPLLTSGTAQYVNFVNPEQDQSPDAFSVSWQYPNFVMTFTNAVVQDWEFARQGNYFYGPGGSLLIHRAGYEVRPAGGGQGGGRGRGGAGAANAPEHKARRPRRSAAGSAAADPAAAGAVARGRWLGQQQRDRRPRPQLPRLCEIAQHTGQRPRNRLLRVPAVPPCSEGGARRPFVPLGRRGEEGGGGIVVDRGPLFMRIVGERAAMRVCALILGVFVVCAAGCGRTDEGRSATTRRVVGMALLTQTHDFYKDLEQARARGSQEPEPRAVDRRLRDGSGEAGGATRGFRHAGRRGDRRRAV